MRHKEAVERWLLSPMGVTEFHVFRENRTSTSDGLQTQSESSSKLTSTSRGKLAGAWRYV
jgi:hypothetical protein